jgi:DNA-binding transcriptional ArsR family regulator
MDERATLHDSDLSAVGALLADPARAAMLRALLGGTAVSAGDLARRAGITAGTASTHLARLHAARWVTIERQGRQRCYRLATPQLAAFLEHAACLAPRLPVRSLRTQRDAEALRLARSCYDHLAGRLGVALAEALVRQELLRVQGANFLLTAEGTRLLQRRGVSVPPATTRRRFARRCLDWSEWRDHVAGALGAALLTAWEAHGWVRRQAQSRAVSLTAEGIAELPAWGVTWPLDDADAAPR